MYGFGDNVKLNEFMPYWGMFSGHLSDYLKTIGVDCHCASVGPISSAWDRACELYAQLFGFTVDYGAAHSRKHNHYRFGRTYKEPLIKDLGKVNNDCSVNKINLIGHSFGGQTIRMLTSLLAFGNKDEINETPEDDISDLFTGKNKNIIHSVTTISSPHNGITSFFANRYTYDISNYFTFMLSNIIGNTELNNIYDVHLEQFGLSGNKKFNKNFSKYTSKIKEVVQGKDQVYYDLSLHGSKKMNKLIKVDPNCYYFSYATCSSEQKLNSSYLSTHKTADSLRRLANSMGKNSINFINDINIDERWLANDGTANTFSSLYPFNDNHSDFVNSKNIYKGIWYVMPIQFFEHMQIVGKVYSKDDKEKYKEFYSNHIKLINSLEI